ncbi:MAG: septation ring formation regulator EzrA [Bacillales bacterium]|nr:septation ring formation regulator EzrA [Bacillales bacterium]
MLLVNGASLFKNPLFVIGLILGLILLVVVSVLVYIFIIKRKQEMKAARDLEKKYRYLHGILTEDIEQYVDRILKISEQNIEYVSLYQQYYDTYNEILKNNDRNSYMVVSGLINTINDKKTHNKNLIDSTKKVVNEFEEKVLELFDDLTALLSKDEEFRQNEVSLQRKFRILKETYSNHETELKVMENSFNKVFKRIEKIFIECEELTSSARYDEASEKLPTIEKVLNALEEAFDKLPNYCVRINTTIPKKMDEIADKYHELEGKEYPLHHLKVMSRLENYKLKLDDIFKRLETFNLKNINNELDEIDNDIMSIFKAFDDEESAKEFFDANCDAVYNATYDIEKHFMRIKRSLPYYKEVYLIKDKYLDKVDELQRDIDNIQTIKRDLDNYIHSSTKQPYTIIVSKIADMEKEMTRINEIIKDYNNYLVSLKSDSENAYRTICDYYLKLKEAEYQLREMAVPQYSDRLRVNFDRAYSYLEQIGESIKAKPIDVGTANDILESARELIDDMLKDVQEQIGQMKYAETSIVYANQYRQGFLDCKYALNNAGASFFEGDFTRTIDETVSILRKMRPDN